MRIRRFCMILAVGIPAHALAEMPKNTLDFELAGTSGFVRLTDLPAKPTIINFWRSDCPACVREMPLLFKTAQSTTIQVIAVAVQRPSETLSAPASISQYMRAPLLILHAPSQPAGLLARFGNPKQILPHTVMLDSQRKVCAMKSGEVDQAWISKASANCP